MALYGKCSNCGTYFMDAFGEFYDFDKQELICPICGSRNIDDVCENEDTHFLSIFDVKEIEKVKKEYDSRK